MQLAVGFVFIVAGALLVWCIIEAFVIMSLSEEIKLYKKETERLNGLLNGR